MFPKYTNNIGVYIFEEKIMDITKQENGFENLKDLFWAANSAFLENHVILLNRELSERCLCGALMCELNKQLEKRNWKNYHADVEFNRDEDSIKCINYITDDGVSLKRIFTDIIVHSFGKERIDNLIALEMKKSSASQTEIDEDKARLRQLTKQNSNTSLCSFAYLLGIYYEINLDKKEIKIEFFYNGNIKEQTFKRRY